MDNVPTLAIQGPIIREVPRILCPTAVFSMDADTIKKIAGETEDKIQERKENSERLTILENGAGICKQYAKQSCEYLLSTLCKDYLLISLVLTPFFQQKAELEAPVLRPRRSPSPANKQVPEIVPPKGNIDNLFTHLMTDGAKLNFGSGSAAKSNPLK